MGCLIVIMTILVIAGCASPNANKEMKPPDPLASSTRPTYNLAGYRPALRMVISMDAKLLRGLRMD